MCTPGAMSCAFGSATANLKNISDEAVTSLSNNSRAISEPVSPEATSIETVLGSDCVAHSKSAAALGPDLKIESE